MKTTCRYVQHLTTMRPGWLQAPTTASSDVPASASGGGGTGPVFSRLSKPEACAWNYDYALTTCRYTGKQDISYWAQRGDVTHVKELLKEGVAVDSVDESGRTALMWAADGGHLALAEHLLAVGAAVNAQVSLAAVR
jgi:hypothetical protein